MIGWVFLSAGVWGADLGPAEKALLAWADRCPSTAMGAGLYDGEGAESVPFGRGTVLRVRTRSEGASPTGSVTETVWMLGGSCRAVGLVEAWAKGDPKRVAGFVVAKEKGAPRADEQAALLVWAGQRVWEPTRPAHALATAAFTPALAPEEVVLGDGLVGTLHRRPGRVWRPGPVPTFEEAWRPGGVAPEGAGCPCWEVYPASPSPAVHVVEDTPHARWAVEPPDPTREPAAASTAIAGTPPGAAARLRWSWSPARPASDEGPADDSIGVTAYDPDTGASFVLRVRPAAAVAWSPSGLRIGSAEIPIATLLGWFPAPGISPER